MGFQHRSQLLRDLGLRTLIGSLVRECCQAFALSVRQRPHPKSRRRKRKRSKRERYGIQHTCGVLARTGSRSDCLKCSKQARKQEKELAEARKQEADLSLSGVLSAFSDSDEAARLPAAQCLQQSCLFVADTPTTPAAPADAAFDVQPTSAREDWMTAPREDTLGLPVHDKAESPPKVWLCLGFRLALYCSLAFVNRQPQSWSCQAIETGISKAGMLLGTGRSRAKVGLVRATTGRRGWACCF